MVVTYWIVALLHSVVGTALRVIQAQRMIHNIETCLCLGVIGADRVLTKNVKFIFIFFALLSIRMNIQHLSACIVCKCLLFIVYSTCKTIQ